MVEIEEELFDLVIRHQIPDASMWTRKLELLNLKEIYILSFTEVWVDDLKPAWSHNFTIEDKSFE